MPGGGDEGADFCYVAAAAAAAAAATASGACSIKTQQDSEEASADEVHEKPSSESRPQRQAGEHSRQSKTNGSPPSIGLAVTHSPVSTPSPNASMSSLSTSSSVSFFRENQYARQILASSIGSIVSVLSLNPITVIKVYIQNSPVVTSNTSVIGSGSGSVVLHSVRQIFKRGGITGFWSGAPMGMAMSVPSTVFYMSAYEVIKEKMEKKIKDTQSRYRPSSPSHPTTEPSSTSSSSLSSTRAAAGAAGAAAGAGAAAASSVELRIANLMQSIFPGVAGGLARTFAVTMTAPLELIRTLQTGGLRLSTYEIARDIFRSGNGFAGFYRGWNSTVLRDCPFSAIYWLSFETLRPVYLSLLQQQQQQQQHKLLQRNAYREQSHQTNDRKQSSQSSSSSSSYVTLATFLAGASSGMAAAIVTHPFDVLKTQHQLALLRETTADSVSSFDGAAANKATSTTTKTTTAAAAGSTNTHTNFAPSSSFSPSSSCNHSSSSSSSNSGMRSRAVGAVGAGGGDSSGSGSVGNVWARKNCVEGRACCIISATESQCRQLPTLRSLYYNTNTCWPSNIHSDIYATISSGSSGSSRGSRGGSGSSGTAAATAATSTTRTTGAIGARAVSAGTTEVVEIAKGVGARVQRTAVSMAKSDMLDPTQALIKQQQQRLRGSIRGWYRGLGMRLATVIPGSAIMVTVYETVKAMDV